MPFDGTLLDQILQHPDMASFVGAIPQGQVQNPLAPNTPVSSPDQVGDDSMSQAPVETPAGGSQRVGASAERRGYSGAVNDQLNARMPREARDEAAAVAAARSGQAGETAATQKYGEMGQNALVAKSTAEQGQAAAQSQGDAAMARLHQHASITESMAAAHAAAMTGQYRANLEADLTKVRAMRVNSGQLFRDMTGTETLGSAMALFAQGFLGTRGVQVDARGALQYWVERSVSDQEDRIRQGQENVQSDKMLWDMARTQSHDDQEVRDRVYAYTLAQAQAEIKAQTDSYGSALAKANGDAAQAALGMDLNAKLAEITDRYDKKAQEAAKFVWTKHIDLAKLSVEQTRASAEMERARREGKGPGLTISDTHGIKTVDPQTGRATVTNIVDPSYKPDQVEKLRTQAAGVSSTNESLRRLGTHIDDLGGRVYGGAGHAMFQGTDKEMLLAERNRLAQDIAYTKWGSRSGSKYDQEVERQLVAIDTMTQRADAPRILNDYVQEQIGTEQQELAQHTFTVDQARQRGWVGPDEGLEGAPVGAGQSWSQPERVLSANTARPPAPATSGTQYLLGNMMVPGGQDKPRTAEASSAVYDLADIAEGRKPVHSSEFSTAGAIRPRPLDEFTGKTISPDQQVGAYRALAAYASGQIKGGTNNEVRAMAEETLKRVDKERADAGLPAMPKLSVQDLAGFDPAEDDSAVAPVETGESSLEDSIPESF